MSKRLPRSSIRVFDPNIGVTLIQGGPLTRGQALIRARGILGPDAIVAQVLDEFPCVFVRRPNGQTFLAGTGPDWESALAGAAGSNYAVEWSDRNIDQGNEIELAKDNLKKTQREVGEKNMKSFFQGLVDLWTKRDETKKENAENYVLWFEGREEEYQIRLRRTELLNAMQPEDRVAFLEEEKRAAKILRRAEYD